MVKIKFRYKYEQFKNSLVPKDTFCSVTIGYNNYNGHARCNLKYDFPNKEIGRKIALKRAIQDLPKEDRKLIWDYYLNNMSFCSSTG